MEFFRNPIQSQTSRDGAKRFPLMSDTPETDDLARGNHVVPTEFAEKLERERNRLAEALEYILGIGLTEKTKSKAEKALQIHE